MQVVRRLIAFVFGLFVLLPFGYLYYLYDRFGFYLTELVGGSLNPGGRIVVITGCDSGFGRMLAAQLDKLGYSVVALCLKDESVDDLKQEMSSSSRFHALQCDVTSQESVDRAVDAVAKLHNNKIFALVNNAGVLDFAPIEWMPMSAFEKDMAVNYFGTVRVSKAFLPMLRRHSRAGARIVNIASIAGTISFQTTAAYSASKYAVEAFSDALRREMDMFGVKVIVIEPSVHKTPMLLDFASGIDKYWNGLAQEIKDDYTVAFKDKAAKTLREQASHPPQGVVDAIKSSLRHLSPLCRYKVGFDAQSSLAALALTNDYIQDCLVQQ